jgi:hypothetical protein
VLSCAGLWDQWKNPETGEPVTSSTIIVAEANAGASPFRDKVHATGLEKSPKTLPSAQDGRFGRTMPQP